MPKTAKEEQMDRLWEAFLRDRPQKEDFIDVIRRVPRFRWAAWGMMMNTGRLDVPGNYELISLMQDVAELREEIWQALVKRGSMTRGEILHVMENIPDYREAAEKILPPSKGDALKQLAELSAS